MDFQRVNAEFVDLRRSLLTFVGEDALAEISVSPPANEDEASFLRLVAWSYALVFEAGRVTIPYLLKLPSQMDRTHKSPHESRELVGSLRTWSFHNLGFSSERDVQISQRVHRWFIMSGGSDPPRDKKTWRACFTELCIHVSLILMHCKSAVELVVAEPDNGEYVINDLTRRLNQNWPPFKFDELVTDAVVRIGQTLDVPKFRESRLSSWRRFLETVPMSDDPRLLLVRLIERDVLDHFESVLPIDGNDIIHILGLPPGRRVADTLISARGHFNAGTKDRDKLLEILREELILEQ